MNHRNKGLLTCAVCIGLVLILMGTAFYLAGKPSFSHQKLVLSKPSGFYDEEFDLEMDAGGDTIYYTLDCSEPNEHSIRYTGPIHIKDASSNENQYCTIEDASPYMNPDLLAQNVVKKILYTIPTSSVDKATIIRAVSIASNGARSDEAKAIYFVGYGNKRGYDGLNIMSVSTDPENLFSSTEGIYVLGEKFLQYMENKEIAEPTTANNDRLDANFLQRGSEWERSAHVCLFNEKREMLFSQICGIRVQGQYSRFLLPKSLNLYARNSYGTSGFDVGSLFGPYEPLTYLNLSNGGNDTNSLLKDYIVNSLADGLDIVTREYKPCVLFLEGEYWGNYWLTPRFKRDYLGQKYHENPENIIVIKKATLEEGDEEDLRQYKEMRQYIANTDMRQPENYEQACALLDMQSTIDYYALELYIANYDWPYNNIALWRTRKKGTSPCSDCKWRWILYDVNVAMSPKYAKTDLMQSAINEDPIFASLMENDAFAEALYARLLSMAELFRPDKTEAFIEIYKADMGEAMAEQYERFFEGKRDVEYFNKKCDAVTEFFAKRYDYITRKYGGQG